MQVGQTRSRETTRPAAPGTIVLSLIVLLSVNKQCSRFNNIHLGTDTMAFSLLYWSNYCLQFTKLQRKSEQAVMSDRVLKFSYDSECKVVQACVQASMKDCSYKVMVSTTSLSYSVQLQISYTSHWPCSMCNCHTCNFFFHSRYFSMSTTV